MRLLLDEMFPPTLAEQLRARGHDVEAVKEHAGMISLPDAVLFGQAQGQRRAVVTENVSDFVRLDGEYRARGQSHFGLVLTSNATFPRGQPATVGALVSALDAFLLHPDLPAADASTITWLSTASP